MEELEKYACSIRRFRFDILGELAKILTHVKTNYHSAVIKVDEEVSKFAMCSYAVKRNCPIFRVKNCGDIFAFKKLPNSI